MSSNPHRLPRTVIPRHYAVELAPQLDEARFSGTVTVELDVTEPVATLVCNAIELDLHEVVLTDATGARQAATVTLDPGLERAELHLGSRVPAGPAHLSVRFDGTLNDKLRGFYRSRFDGPDSTSHTIATTQFEATDARRAFPCWDEPDLKATFDITLVAPADATVLSCMSPVADEVIDGDRHVRFATTPPLSTYLLAFVVGPLEATAPIDVDGVPLRIVHPPGAADQTSYAAEVGEFALRFLTDWFGLPYPGDKLDLVAIPDFAMGAMENLGCVTFRDVYLLADRERATQSDLEHICDIVAHEIAHMWFGNLVTMRWWEGIWLKEAFATFMEVLTTDAYRPEWQRWTQFALSRTAAFDVDALAATRPIEYEVVSPDDAEAMYDVITYEKGASVVRMLQQFLGEDDFRDGIGHYLRTHRFANTVTADLWDALEHTSGQPIRRVMDTWITRPGHPLVTLTPAGDGRLRVAQQRFCFTDEVAEPAPASPRWEIPLVVSVGRGDERRVHRLLLSEAVTELDVGPYDWVLANTGGNGFHRSLHRGELHDALVEARARLAPVERYGLVDDSWALTVSGRRDLTGHLELVWALADEQDASVWERMCSTLQAIDHLAPDDDTRHRLATWSLELTADITARLGPDPGPGDDDRTRELRATLLAVRGAFGADGALDRAHSLLVDPHADPALRAAAIAVVARHGDADRFDRHLAAYRDAPTPQERLRFLEALALFPGGDEMERLCELTLGTVIRTQDIPFVLRRAMGNRTTGTLAWSHVRDNWDTWNERLPDNTIIRMVEGVSALSHPDLSREIQEFFAAHPVPQAGARLAQALERLRVQVGFRFRVADQLGPALA